jgi:hypothetical protein
MRRPGATANVNARRTMVTEAATAFSGSTSLTTDLGLVPAVITRECPFCLTVTVAARDTDGPAPCIRCGDAIEDAV